MKGLEGRSQEEQRAALEALRNPAISLPAYATLVDQAEGDILKFDPTRITYDLQNTVVAYTSDTPRTEIGQTKWLALLGYRQGGKSLTAELCGYPKAAYTPGFDHVCIADRRDRAEYLHKRLHICHNNWPTAIRAKTMNSREVRQLTFANGGSMRVLSGEQGAVGIGQSPDYFHGSELPYWTDASGQYSMIYPSMINRNHALMLLESTPAPLDYPSAEWWRDHCNTAKRGDGRWLYAFFPYWDGKLNVRPWPKGSPLSIEEMRLLDRYGPKGLTKEHLAFRRLMIDTDDEIRRNPALFPVFYPFDDLTCWPSVGRSVIHQDLLARHLDDLVPWDAPNPNQPWYKEYEPPEAGAIYVIGVDPAGWGARDHASFHVLKCYVGEWKQVAVFGGVTDPVDLADALTRAGYRYNKALIGVERNGPGEGFLALLIDRKYPNVYYDGAYKPGVWKVSDSQMLAHLTEALKDELELNDEDTWSQLDTYRNDKRIQRSVSSEILAGPRRNRRRDRHHWDKVSALCVAVVVARSAPARFKQRTEESNVIHFKDMTYNQVEKYRKEAYKSSEPTKPKPRYKSVRRKRRK